MPLTHSQYHQSPKVARSPLPPSPAWSAAFYGYAQLRRIAGTFAQGHDRSSFFTARMRSRAIHPASEAASWVEYDSPVLSAQLGSSIRVITEAAASEVGLAAEVRDLLKEVLADPTGWLGRQDSKLR